MRDDEFDDDERVELPSIRKDEPTATQVFLAWEKLRLVYNAVLVAVVMLRMLIEDDLNLEAIIAGALGANLCYCAGPVAEGYVCWICRLNRPVVRHVVFGLGMILAIVMAFNVRAGELVLWLP